MRLLIVLLVGVLGLDDRGQVQGLPRPSDELDSVYLAGVVGVGPDGGVVVATAHGPLASPVKPFLGSTSPAVCRGLGLLDVLSDSLGVG